MVLNSYPIKTRLHNLSIKRLLSSDSHIIEPPDLWVSRVPRKLKDKVPHVERVGQTDWWIYNGHKIGSVSGRKHRSGSTGIGGSIESDGAVLTYSIFEEVTPAAYTPDLYLQSHFDDGVVGAVIRPTQGVTNYCIDEAEIFGHICRAYNDWMAEFFSVSPRNLKGIAMLNNYAPDDAVRELERCKKLGFAGGMISVYPGRDKHYGLPQYDRLWAAAASHNFPLSMHALSNHTGPYGVSFEQVNYSLRANADYWIRTSLADMIFHGVFERYPELTVESCEHEAGWVPYFRWQLDWIYEHRILKRRQVTTLSRNPSTYLSDNVFFSIIYDELAISQCELIGTGRMMWGSDFPHEQSMHPNSLQMVNTLLKNLELRDAEKIAFRTTAQRYNFDLDHPKLQLPSLCQDAYHLC
jgi:predicted TIM-barrel fold metal-dependent hydrolase